MVLVYIPAGEFEMGSEEGDSDESPVHTVYLDAYWMDQTEVTNAMYAAFLNDQGNQRGGGTFWLDVYGSEVMIEEIDGVWQSTGEYNGFRPVNEVTWYGAQAYCAWAGRRLPTEAEWEKAARGGLVGVKYPWGDNDPTCTAGRQNGAQYYGCPGRIAQVMKFEANGFGLYDMAGNLWEWVNDWYAPDYYEGSPDSNPQGPPNGSRRVVRGGSYTDSEEYLGVVLREGTPPNQSWNDQGFRCAQSVEVTPEMGNSTEDSQSQAMTPTNIAIPPTATAVVLEFSFVVYADQEIQDTGIECVKGDEVTITSIGSWSHGFEGGSINDVPFYDGDGYESKVSSQWIPSATLGALLGRIGEGDFFVIGSSSTFTCTQSGNIFLLMNDSSGAYANNEGFLNTSITLER
jgi:formylglycine-generating enzyme required for sulfatase activity